MEELLHLLEHTFLDTVKMIPFLFLAYWLIEYFEHRAGEKFRASLSRLGKWGPVGGALLGCVPQCSFSVAAVNLFSGRIITGGTLIAVFLATSDEALPILAAHPESWSLILPLIGAKLLIGILAGFLFDRLSFARRLQADCPGHDTHEHCHNVSSHIKVLLSALRHTLFIYLFVFIVTVLLDAFIHYIGEDTLAQVLLTNTFLQPIAAGVLGLIPNCAPSIILTELYLAGSIGFGAMLAGLCTSAGLGLLVLFRMHRAPKQNFFLLLYLLTAGILAGLLVQLFMG